MTYRPGPGLTEREASGAFRPAVVVTGLVSGVGTAQVAAANTAAIQAALNAAVVNIGTGPGGTSPAGYGGTVQIPAGKFYFSGDIVVPNCADLIGVGENATLLLAYNATARLVFGDLGGASLISNYGGQSGHFRLEGRNLATNPMAVGLCVSRHFTNIRISEAAGDGLRLEQTQNCLFTLVDAEDCGGSGVALDYGAGGNAFYKCEFSRNAYANGRTMTSGAVTGPGYGVPTHNLFSHCLFENGVPGCVACFAVDSTASLWFETCVLSLNPEYAAGGGGNVPVLRVKNMAGSTCVQSVYLGSGCRIVGSGSLAGPTWVGYGIQVETGPADAVASVVIGEQVIFSQLDTLFRACAAARIDVVGRFTAQHFTNRFAVTDAGAQTEASIVLNRGGQADLTADDPAKPAITLRANAAQTGNVLELRNTGGALVVNISASGSMTSLATITANRFATSARGSAATPAYSFGGAADLTTGIYSQGAGGMTLLAAGVARIATDGTGVGFNGSAPVAKAASPGVAAGTDAAVINAIVTALRNLGLVT